MKQPTTNDWLGDVRRELADHQQQVAEGKTFDGYVWLTMQRLVERIDALEANEAMRSGFKRLDLNAHGHNTPLPSGNQP